MFGSLSNWIQSNIPVQIPPLFKPNDENEQVKSGDDLNKNENEQQQTKEANLNENTQNANSNAANDEKKVEQSSIDEIQKVDSASAVEPKPADNKGENDDDDADNLDELKLLNIDKQKAIDTAKEIGNYILSFGKTASKQIQEKATHFKDVIEKNTLIGDFSKENEKFVNEKKTQQRREEAAVPPWVGYVEEEKMKQQILSLSSDSRNFLRNPPAGVEFQFDFNVAYPIALATLEEDPSLKEMRFNLVPKQINEELFWRNYFYRVSLIKQSTQLNELANEHIIYTNENKDGSDKETEKNATKNVQVKQENNTNTDISNVDANSPPTNEFVSDLYETTINEEEIKREMKQLKLDNSKINDDLDDHDWDKEIDQVDDIDNITAEELEKEISEMIQSDANTK